ncbi:SOS response-associated peptidase [Candidatus Saccharibacteria bacterium]|nr:SOS response-associated peptidase [Candidatus Saccharibacteria bacterium]
MCGRYALAIKSGVKLAAAPLPDSVYSTPRYNVGPGQSVPILTANGWERAHFGLVPAWAKSPGAGYTMINARAETLMEKRTYSGLLKAHRCLIPASGFFEWEKAGKDKLPYYFTVKDAPIIAFAGLWTERKDSEGVVLKSFTIITTEANELLAKIHDRMPVILDEAVQAEWLSLDGGDTVGLMSLLQPYPAAKMDSHRVSTDVNKVSNDAANLLNSL